MAYNSTDIIEQGIYFENASLLLEKETLKNINSNVILKNQQNSHLIPATTLFGFSLELYLKGIYFFENSQICKEHDLKILFQQLSLESQNSIRDFYYKCPNKKELDGTKKKYEELSKINISDDFEEQLTSLSKTFIEFRYIFEKPTLTKDLYYRDIVRISIINRINELKILDYLLF